MRSCVCRSFVRTAKCKSRVTRLMGETPRLHARPAMRKAVKRFVNITSLRRYPRPSAVGPCEHGLRHAPSGASPKREDGRPGGQAAAGGCVKLENGCLSYRSFSTLTLDTFLRSRPSGPPVPLHPSGPTAAAPTSTFSKRRANEHPASREAAPTGADVRRGRCSGDGGLGCRLWAKRLSLRPARQRRRPMRHNPAQPLRAPLRALTQVRAPGSRSLRAMPRLEASFASRVLRLAGMLLAASVVFLLLAVPASANQCAATPPTELEVRPTRARRARGPIARARAHRRGGAHRTMQSDRPEGSPDYCHTRRCARSGVAAPASPQRRGTRCGRGRQGAAAWRREARVAHNRSRTLKRSPPPTTHQSPRCSKRDRSPCVDAALNNKCHG
jgi:hypothetical protein